MIVALSDDENYRIIWIKEFGTNCLSEYQVHMNKGQAFSLVSWTTTYIWAVGRAVDGSNNEQAFHHLKLNKIDGVIDSAFYK